jgi:hypothetical protein
LRRNWPAGDSGPFASLQSTHRLLFGPHQGEVSRGRGPISGYNEVEPRPGPPNLFNITTKRRTMKGLIVGDWLDRQAEFEKEVGSYFEAGKLKNRETVAKGIDRAVDAFIGLFQGRNIGKMVVQLA